MLTGIKGSGFGAAGTALQVGAVVPGTIGDGFIWVGNKFVSLADCMARTGARWKVYGAALCDLEAGKFTEADVAETMKANNVDYRTAVIACAKAAAVTDAVVAEKAAPAAVVRDDLPEEMGEAAIAAEKRTVAEQKPAAEKPAEKPATATGLFKRVDLSATAVDATAADIAASMA